MLSWQCQWPSLLTFPRKNTYHFWILDNHHCFLWINVHWFQWSQLITNQFTFPQSCYKDTSIGMKCVMNQTSYTGNYVPMNLWNLDYPQIIYCPSLLDKGLGQSKLEPGNAPHWCWYFISLITCIEGIICKDLLILFWELFPIWLQMERSLVCIEHT